MGGEISTLDEQTPVDYLSELPTNSGSSAAKMLPPQ